MSTMLAIAAVVAALMLIFGLVRFSLLMTERKPNEELKKRLPDASSANADSGYATPGGGD